MIVGALAEHRKMVVMQVMRRLEIALPIVFTEEEAIVARVWRSPNGRIVECQITKGFLEFFSCVHEIAFHLAHEHCHLKLRHLTSDVLTTSELWEQEDAADAYATYLLKRRGFDVRRGISWLSRTTTIDDDPSLYWLLYEEAPAHPPSEHRIRRIEELLNSASSCMGR
jgi:hypothetical protein